jgi:hypothetical protein
MYISAKVLAESEIDYNLINIHGGCNLYKFVKFLSVFYIFRADKTPSLCSMSKTGKIAEIGCQIDVSYG